MSSTQQPKLRTRPPKLPDAAAAMRRLEALDEWTEQPARDAAAALGERKEAAKPAAVPAKPKTKPTAKPKKAVEKKAEKQGAPWDVIEVKGGGSIQPCSFRLPMELYKQLIWLSGTTLGYNQTRIVKEALTEKIDKMLKERGIEPHEAAK